MCEYPASGDPVCLCVKGGDITIKIPCTEADATYLDSFSDAVQLWDDDARPYRIVGTKQKKMRHRAAALLAILRGYVGAGQRSKPQSLVKDVPAEPEDPQSVLQEQQGQCEKSTCSVSVLKHTIAEQDNELLIERAKCAKQGSKLELMRKVTPVHTLIK